MTASRPDTDHYFSSLPTSKNKERHVTLRLADGRSVRLVTAAGTFSPSEIDKGTLVLLANAPCPPAGANVLDIGCGYGPIACRHALDEPTARIVAIDINDRALALMKQNVTALGLDNVTVTTPDGVDPSLSFDVIYSNPPIRIGKKALQGILKGWLMRLAPTGFAYLVVHKHLGSDSLHRWMSQESWVVERIASEQGFRVLKVGRPT